jgi:hypothetical protein
MSTLSVETTDGRTAFEPGEEIEVELQWELEEAPQAIELRLVWNTSGKGTTDVEVARAEQIEEPSATGRVRKTLQLPRSPYSFSGKLVAIIWALELVALPKEESTRLEITIGPGGEEVRLGDPHEEFA